MPNWSVVFPARAETLSLGSKDKILDWTLRDDLEAIVRRGLQDFNQCVIDHFSDGPAVIGSLALCKIDSSKWHDRSPSID
jgi:hypothetical protein